MTRGPANQPMTITRVPHPRPGRPSRDRQDPDWADPKVPHGVVRRRAEYNRVDCRCGWYGSPEAYQRIHLRQRT